MSAFIISQLRDLALMEQFWQGMAFSIDIIMPLVGLIWFGRWLRTSGQIREQFLAEVNQLLYRYGIPSLLFFSILKSQESFSSQWKLVSAAYLATYSLYLGSRVIANKMIAHPADRGVFVQGVFRGNLAILGLAFVIHTYGDYGREVGGILAGAVAFEFNVLSVICLNQAMQSQGVMQTRWQMYCDMLLKMLKNPLIIGIFLGFCCKALAFPVPKAFFSFGELFTRITLPLSLISIGAVFDLRGIFSANQMAIWASIGRLLISPLCFLIFGLLFDLQGKALGVLCLMGAVPAANAGYIMAKSLGGNAVAAANIIAITTAASLIIIAPIIAILHMLNWI